MIIELNINEIIPFKDFSLNWRWDEVHNPNVTSEDIQLIKPLSEIESKRINKVIAYFEVERNLCKSFSPSEWFNASCESKESIKKFSEEFSKLTEDYTENLYISWNRKTCVYTTKEIFIKYWDDFCYQISDDITIISTMTNWVYFYNHIGVGRLWKRKIN